MTKFAIPEVAYPYVYIPSYEFDVIAKTLNEFFLEKTNEVVCSKTSGKCQMKKSCDVYRDIPLPGGFLNLTLQDDDENKIRIHLTNENMFLNSSQIKFPSGSEFQCQIPIFSQLSDLNSDTWYLGKAMMSSYYMIFDANNLEDDEGNFDSNGYLQVGIGPINPDDEIGGRIIDKHEKDKKA